MEMKLLFWNLQKKDLTKQIAELIYEQQPTIVSLAEGDKTPLTDLLALINSQNGHQYHHIDNPGCDKINILCSKSINLELSHQHKDYSVIKINLSSEIYLLCFVHLPSKLYQLEDQQRRACERLSKTIISEEELHNTENTIIMGDFNINPYESAMVSFSGLAASNGIDCSQRRSVKSDGETSKLFYNPMWTLYSQYKERPGSYRYSQPGNNILSWHFLDQVIIRPNLVGKFDFNSLKFIIKTKNFTYTDKHGRPSISDHLPLICEFK